jgi:hypothetical protein
MVLYDSSVLIDYLDGVDEAVEYVDEHLDDRAIAPPLVLFEIYQGEVYKSGPADFDAVDGALGWLTVVDETSETARTAAELQRDLRQRGGSLTARDAFIAGSAKARGERLVVADADFAVDGLAAVLDVDVL